MRNMPLNKYFWLVNLLYSTGGLSRLEIDERWSKCSLNEYQESHIPERSFHHWKTMIARELGLHISYSRHLDKYYIEEGGIDGNNDAFNWMMRSITVAEVIKNSSNLKDRILLEYMPSGEKWLGTIINAMNANKVLEMTYKRFDAKNIDEMKFKPYCLKTFRLRWYVVGESSNHKNEIRVYALDRVLDMQICDKSFRMPKNFNAEELFKDYFGIWLGTDKKTERVRVLVNETESNYLRTLPLHSSQREIGPADKKGWIKFEWKIKVTPDFIMELQSKGDSIKVLEPEWLLQH